MADNMKHPLSRSEYLFEFQRKKQNRLILNSKRNTKIKYVIVLIFAVKGCETYNIHFYEENSEFHIILRHIYFDLSEKKNIKRN